MTHSQTSVDLHIFRPVRRSRLLTPMDMARNREVVLSAAKRLFLDRGYAVVGVDDIAEAAQVAGHVPGHYFGGKRMMLIRVTEEMEHGVLDALAYRGPAARDPFGAALEQVTGVLLGQDWIDLASLHGFGPDIGRKLAQRWSRQVHEALGARISHIPGQELKVPADAVAARVLELCAQANASRATGKILLPDQRGRVAEAARRHVEAMAVRLQGAG